MKIGFGKIGKSFIGVFSFLKRKIFVIDSNKNWRFIVFIFVLLVAYMVISKFLLFYKISSDDFIFADEEREVSVETIDRGILSNVLDGYKLKEDRFETLKSNPPAIPEP